uniref:Uncharacterized protein n=1 Tax=Zea mays TaxID=4577 RepID=A0A804N5P9_MAIZE
MMLVEGAMRRHRREAARCGGRGGGGVAREGVTGASTLHRGSAPTPLRARPASVTPRPPPPTISLCDPAPLLRTSPLIQRNPSTSSPTPWLRRRLRDPRDRASLRAILARARPPDKAVAGRGHAAVHAATRAGHLPRGQQSALCPHLPLRARTRPIHEQALAARRGRLLAAPSARLEAPEAQPRRSLRRRSKPSDSHPSSPVSFPNPTPSLLGPPLPLSLRPRRQHPHRPPPPPPALLNRFAESRCSKGTYTELLVMPDNVVDVFLFCLIAGYSICWFNTVCFVLCIRSFSASNRSLALSLSISFNGLSAPFYTLFANALSPFSPAVYLLLNAILPLAVSVLALPAILLCHKNEGHIQSAMVLLALPLIIPACSSCSYVDTDGPDPAYDDPHKPLLISNSHQMESNAMMQKPKENQMQVKGRLETLGEEHSAKKLIRCVDFWLYYTAYFCGATVGLIYNNNLGQIAQSLHQQSQLTMLLVVYSSCSFFGRLLSTLPDLLHRKVSLARTGWLAAALVPMPMAFSLCGTNKMEAPCVGVNHNILITNIPLGSLLYGQIAAMVYDANGQKMTVVDNRTGIVDTMIVCIGVKCYSTTFVVWACITFLGLITSFDEVRVYPIPVMLYLVKNLLQYYIFEYVDAPAYQILKNLNIISTGVLYRIILKKKSDHVLQTPIRGWVMAIVMALLSGFAGVYTEVIIKKNPSRNINAQNFWLYIFGMLFNLVAICVQDFDAVMNKGFFHGEVYMSTTIIWIKNISKMLPAQTMMQEELLPSLKMQKSECLLTNLKTP